jgi:hypothetical protein
MEPSHEQVRRAVQATGDPELLALTSRPEAYVLRPAAMQAREFDVFHVVLVEVAHATGFVLASRPGDVRVTSGQPRNVAAVLAADPGLGDPGAVWELVRDPPLDGELIDAERTAPGRYAFHIRDRVSGAERRLALVLDAEPPTFGPAP